MLPCHILGGEVNVSFCNENSYNNSTHSYYLNPLSLSTLTDPHKLTVPTSLKQLTNTVPSHRPIARPAAAHASNAGSTRHVHHSSLQQTRHVTKLPWMMTTGSAAAPVSIWVGRQ